MPLQKDVPILELLRNRLIVSLGSINSARTIETRRLWEHRKECYQQAIDYVRLAEGLDATSNEPPMDFSGEDLPCLKN